MAERRSSRSKASTPTTGARRRSRTSPSRSRAARRRSSAATAWARRRSATRSSACRPRASPARSATEGQELVGKPSYRIAKLGIGYVPQGRRLFPSLSRRRAPADARARAAVEALDGRARLRALPAPRRAQAERRRTALGRRAADARDRARAADEPDAADHGRAVRGARAGDHRAPDRDVQEARAGRARDAADRAEPRRRDGDRRAAARDGRGLDLRRDDGRPSCRRTRSCSAASSASSRWRRAPSGARRPARDARHEGPRVRVPARPASRARGRGARRRRGHQRAGRHRAGHLARRGRARGRR